MTGTDSRRRPLMGESVTPKRKSDPWTDGWPGWRGRRGCAYEDGSRASWHDGGYSAEKSACSLWYLQDCLFGPTLMQVSAGDVHAERQRVGAFGSPAPSDTLASFPKIPRQRIRAGGHNPTRRRLTNSTSRSTPWSSHSLRKLPDRTQVTDPTRHPPEGSPTYQHGVQSRTCTAVDNARIFSAPLAAACRETTSL